MAAGMVQLLAPWVCEPMVPGLIYLWAYVQKGHFIHITHFPSLAAWLNVTYMYEAERIMKP